jgi:hypothetical protein
LLIPVNDIRTACNTDAVIHLLKSCDGIAICYDEKNSKALPSALELARRLKTSENTAIKTEMLATKKPVSLIPMVWKSVHDIRQLGSSTSRRVSNDIFNPQDAEDVVLYGHSSGTSTGVPKPIPITHQDEIGALPRLHQLININQPSTFTTTPIYTGGLADLWRSWSAASAVWLFPENQIPITGQNILKYLQTSKDWLEDNQARASPIGHLSCVPFVAQIMVEDGILLDWLRNLETIGVGGAAMPKELGDSLVQKDVNLVSRFGSRECGCKHVLILPPCTK